MSDFLNFSMYTLQEVCLAIMAITYTIRVIWFLRHKPGKERQAPTGAMDTTARMLKPKSNSSEASSGYRDSLLNAAALATASPPRE